MKLRASPDCPFGVWDRLGYKGSVGVRGRNDVPFGLLFLSEQKITLCSQSALKYTPTDCLPRVRGSEIILFTMLLSPSVSAVVFSLPPSLFHFPPSVLSQILPWDLQPQ